MRPAVWFVLVGALGAGCDALLSIPSQETYDGDGGSHRDAAMPADAGSEGATFDAGGGQDSTLVDGGQDATEAGEDDAVAESGPDCAPSYDPSRNWASWPMPNSRQDVEAGSPHPESYADNFDGTVTDNVTGLMWQQKPPTSMLAWSAARDYCATLGLSGYADWRLPSYVELVSLVDYGPATPAVIATYFPGTPTYKFWSSTPFAAKPTVETPSAWYVDFTQGWTQETILTDMKFARCVRQTYDAGAPSCRYVVDGVAVKDTMTGLTWQQAVGTFALAADWPTAMQYCATLKVGVWPDHWRLPTIKELLTLVDVSVDVLATMGFAIDARVFQTPMNALWSSTLSPGATPEAFVLTFGGAVEADDTSKFALSALCVE
jgi:hypothetical protein